MPPTTLEMVASGAPSEYDMLMARLQEMPHDPENWKRLVHVAKSSGDMACTCQSYKSLLEQYPHSPSAVIVYLAHVLARTTDPTECEALFTQYVRPSPSVAVWRWYLDYITRPNLAPASPRTAYEYVLEHIGQDRDSGSIWADYIQLLKWEKTTNTCDAHQKTDRLRSVYHRVVQIPLGNIDQLWADFTAFEIGLDVIAAEKFMANIFPAYKRAQNVLRQLSTHLSGLSLTTTEDTGKLWLPALPTFSAEERPLIWRWKAYLKWEEGNPLKIEEKNYANFTLRVQMAYRKAILHMRYYPEIWFMAYSWNSSSGRHEEATSILKAGLQAVPDSFVLTYAYAELLEKTEPKENVGKVHNLYTDFLGMLRTKLVQLSTSISKIHDGFNAEGTEGAAPLAASVPSPTIQDDLDERKKQCTTVWINYMRFVRRAEGHTAYRKLFRKARHEEYIGWEVFEAAALTEYYCDIETGNNSGTEVARRIFQSGMTKFGSDVQYILAHLEFLLSVNDEDNAGALFERVIGAFTPQQARPIWECWSRFQYQYGNLQATLDLEQRMAEVYNDPPLKRFAQRHTSHSIDAIASHDLGFARRSALPPVLERQNAMVLRENDNVPIPTDGRLENKGLKRRLPFPLQ